MDSMRIVVDRGRCTGIGICESIAEMYFEVGDDGGMVVLRDDIAEADRESVERAVRSCPAVALSIQAGDRQNG
jgi:ferredoxin